MLCQSSLILIKSFIIFKEFIIHTPTFEATKCWVGNLGNSATHALVYAQLYTPDGRCHGLHSFVVQVRSTVDLSPLPGVTVGDLGEKLGQNGLDNGYDCFFFSYEGEQVVNIDRL